MGTTPDGMHWVSIEHRCGVMLQVVVNGVELDMMRCARAYGASYLRLSDIACRRDGIVRWVFHLGLLIIGGVTHTDIDTIGSLAKYGYFNVACF